MAGGQKPNWDLDVARPAQHGAYTVKRKVLPRWVTPGVVACGIAAFVVTLALLLPLVRDTRSRHLAPTLLMLGLSIPMLAFTGTKILQDSPLFGESLVPDVGGTSKWLTYRLFFGSWIVFLAGIVSYLRFISVL